ncbi:MAG: C25 family cysteine peptidase [Fibromonadaceae bacterium]|nr:C25 family cysteine peptidase [Fibromonadaceae bacterium]
MPRFAFKILFLPLCVFALEIQRDLSNEFIFTDKVSALSETPCKNDVFFMPENASFFGEAEAPGTPFRTYIIALPNSALPSVEVQNIKTERVSGKPCGVAENPNSLQIGKPYLKDNLWRVKISVPLLYSSGNSWNLRKDFRVKINFSGSASGHSIGKRALASVENKNAASRFGTRSISHALTRSSVENIDWLLKIGVGSNNATDLNTSADGMYALAFDDLKKTGADISDIRISNLRLFGASPDTLAEHMAEEIFPNAMQMPIRIKDKNGNDKNANEMFVSGDTIFFFGYGTAIWKKNNSPSQSGMDYYFSSSPYSFYQHFYLGISGIGKQEKLESNPKNITGRDITWKKYVRSEKDLLLRDNYFGESRIEENTGKEWFWKWGIRGETVTVTPDEFHNSVRSLTGVQSGPMHIGVSFLPRRSTQSNPSFSAATRWQDRMRGINFSFYHQGQRLQNIADTLVGTFVFSVPNTTANNSYRVEITSTGQNDRFDGLSIAYNYNIMQSTGEEWLFPGTETGAIKIPVPANMELIKTENFIPVEILTPGADGYAHDIISSEGDTKYFLHRKGRYRTPAIIEAIPGRVNAVSEPQRIPSNTEYLILTSEVLQNSAVKLKQFRESHDTPTKGLNTAVVLVEDIYREHGAQSSPIAIRDYIRYAKNRSPDLRYVLLAGGGTYDYRKIRGGTKSNIIPPYESEDMSTDDFFVVLEPGEKVRFGGYELSLAIGRLPVSNISEFENYIQKAKDYEQVSVMDNGIWRNTIIFGADDAMQGPVPDPVKDHTDQMEKTIAHIDTLVRKQDFAINWRKISLLQYESDGNYKKPDASRELLLRLNQGALFTFFYGHGNAVMWADEDLLNVNSLNHLSNKGRYTILGSFSCLVARFDDIATSSLSEAFVSARDRGAIASIGSLRESYSIYNEALSKKILNQSLTMNTSLGDAILRAKQSVATSPTSYNAERYNNEKYVLLGEPVLSMPRREITLGLIDPPDTIQALQKLKISGTASVQTGAVRMQILEGEKQRTLSQNLGNGNFYTTQIKVEGSPIYSEELQIRNGKFETEFITPRKLSLGDTSAQIRLWAHRPGSVEIGKFAIFDRTLYGTSPDAALIEDNTPPSIAIFPCKRSKKVAPYAENARVSLEIPACLEIEIEDDTGIDYREEADEGITFEVSPTVNAWHPWSFTEQTGKRAALRMNFGHTYDPGEYVFKVTAQDILGNIAFRSLRVSLNSEIKSGLADVFNIPNPMKRGGTTFYFKDLSGEERLSNVTIKIFDQNGKLVKTINNAVSGETSWDGRDSRGRLLANGLYHYVVQSTVSSLNETGSKKTFVKKQKLVISR